MSVQISWAIEGEQQLSRVLRGIGDGIKDWRPAFEEAAADLVKVFANDVFNTEGKAIQESWRPLRARYLKQKVKQGYPPDILVKTGKMQKSFQSLFKGDYAEVWNSAAYFKYHQSKSPRSSNLPRRVMLKLGEQQKQMVVKVFHQHWQRKVKDKL